jgi:hypothetical protein
MRQRVHAHLSQTAGCLKIIGTKSVTLRCALLRASKGDGPAASAVILRGSGFALAPQDDGTDGTLSRSFPRKRASATTQTSSRAGYRALNRFG